MNAGTGDTNMVDHELVKKVKDVALSHGADLVGIVKVARFART